MTAKTEVQILHECWTRKVKPILDDIIKGKIPPIHKGDLLRQCFEKYPVSPFKLEYMILKFYVETGAIEVTTEGKYSPALEVTHVR